MRTDNGFNDGVASARRFNEMGWTHQPGGPWVPTGTAGRRCDCTICNKARAYAADWFDGFRSIRP